MGIHAVTREVQFPEICGDFGGYMQVWIALSAPFRMLLEEAVVRIVRLTWA